MATDRLGRRSRFRRTATGKRLFLTERDLAILRALYRYRYLRASHLVALLQPRSEKRLIERLGDLFHEIGLVDRPAAQWQRFDARYVPLIYELSRKGWALLQGQGELPYRAVTFSDGARRSLAPQFEHAMMIVDALVEVEIACRMATGQRFVPVDEILARMPQRRNSAHAPKHPLATPVTIRPNPHLPTIVEPTRTHLIPDALYGIEYMIDSDKRYRFYCLECERKSPDRRSKALSSTALKRAAYEALITGRHYRDAWGIPNVELRIHRRDAAAS